MSRTLRTPRTNIGGSTNYRPKSQDGLSSEELGVLATERSKAIREADPLYVEKKAIIDQEVAIVQDLRKQELVSKKNEKQLEKTYQNLIKVGIVAAFLTAVYLIWTSGGKK